MLLHCVPATHCSSCPIAASQDRWRGLPRRLQQQGEREQKEGEGEQQRRQVARRYQRWEEEEADDVAELLGALGERLAAAAGTGLPPRLRTLHERLEFVVS